MTEFQQMIEALIDQLLLRVPSSIFVDFPLLGVLLANPNGRYVLVGLGIVIIFMAFGFLSVLSRFYLASKQNLMRT